MKGAYFSFQSHVGGFVVNFQGASSIMSETVDILGCGLGLPTSSVDNSGFEFLFHLFVLPDALKTGSSQRPHLSLPVVIHACIISYHVLMVRDFINCSLTLICF